MSKFKCWFCGWVQRLFGPTETERSKKERANTYLELDPNDHQKYGEYSILRKRDGWYMFVGVTPDMTSWEGPFVSYDLAEDKLKEYVRAHPQKFSRFTHLLDK